MRKSKNRNFSGRLAIWLSAGALLVGGVAYIAAAQVPQTSILSVHRLTQDQYRRSIADIFGDDIKISARLEPDPRRDGLIAIGVTQATVGASGFEQYDSAAREVAAQVTDAKHRDLLVGCKPADPAQADDACARAFLTRAGRMLYRRPLQPAEVARYVGVARQAAASRKDFFGGVSVSLAAMLDSAPFIFRTERAVWKDGRYQLDDYAKASRLSFLLWDAPPDQALLDATDKGELGTPDGLSRQVDRMLASQRFEDGVRAFFSDMFELEDIDGLEKDPTIYPRYNTKLALDAREQTLRTVVDTLVRRNEDYRDLFTTRRTFLSRSLGVLYSVPVASRVGWEAHEFPAGDPRAGILAEPAFLMAHSHPGRSSPTLRGKAIRELILCQIIPPPPANVNFAIVQNVTDPHFATARLRLAAHRVQPSCAGCHRLMDPLGLPLEGLDGGAGMRTTENGAPIDLSGDLGGKAFVGPEGLGQAVAADPALSSCLVNRIYSYGVGRIPDAAAHSTLDVIRTRYLKDGLKIRDIMRAISLTDDFFRPLGGDDSNKVAGETPRGAG